MPCKTRKLWLVGTWSWKHEMIISAIIDEFGVNLSGITSQNGLFIEKLINEYSKRIEF